MVKKQGFDTIKSMKKTYLQETEQKKHTEN